MLLEGVLLRGGYVFERRDSDVGLVLVGGGSLVSSLGLGSADSGDAGFFFRFRSLYPSPVEAILGEREFKGGLGFGSSLTGSWGPATEEILLVLRDDRVDTDSGVHGGERVTR